jgi:hypothetical protein
MLKKSVMGVVVGSFLLFQGCQQTGVGPTTTPTTAKTSGYVQPAQANTAANYGSYILIATQLLQQMLPLLTAGGAQPQPQPMPQAGAVNGAINTGANTLNRVGGAVNMVSGLMGAQQPQPVQQVPNQGVVQPSLINPQTIQALIGVMGAMNGGVPQR